MKPAHTLQLRLARDEADAIVDAIAMVADAITGTPELAAARWRLQWIEGALDAVLEQHGDGFEGIEVDVDSGRLVRDALRSAIAVREHCARAVAQRVIGRTAACVEPEPESTVLRRLERRLAEVAS